VSQLKLGRTIQTKDGSYPDRMEWSKCVLMEAIKKCDKMASRLKLTMSMTATADYYWLVAEDPHWAILIESDSIEAKKSNIALVYIDKGADIYVLRKANIILSEELAFVKLYQFYISMIASHWIIEESSTAQALVEHCRNGKSETMLRQIKDTEQIYSELLNGRIQEDSLELDFKLKEAS